MTDAEIYRLFIICFGIGFVVIPAVVGLGVGVYCLVRRGRSK